MKKHIRVCRNKNLKRDTQTAKPSIFPYIHANIFKQNHRRLLDVIFARRSTLVLALIIKAESGARDFFFIAGWREGFDVARARLPAALTLKKTAAAQAREIWNLNDELKSHPGPIIRGSRRRSTTQNRINHRGLVTSARDCIVICLKMRDARLDCSRRWDARLLIDSWR